MTRLSLKQRLPVITILAEALQIAGEAEPPARTNACQGGPDWRLRLIEKPARGIGPFSWLRKVRTHV
jgi:hypothetical protein